MARDTHIIHRVNLEIDVPDQRLANQMKDDALRVLYNDLLPGIEKYLDSLALRDTHIHVNQLNINLDELSEENFEKEFNWAFLQTFHEKAENMVKPGPFTESSTNSDEDEAITKFTAEELTFRSFLFFLETGRLPWWSKKSGDELEEQSLLPIFNSLSPEYQEQLHRVLRQNTITLERLLNQFSLQLFFQIVFSQTNGQSVFAGEILPRQIFVALQNLGRKKPDLGSLSSLQQIFIKRIIRLTIRQKESFPDQGIDSSIDELFSEIEMLDPVNQLDLKPFFDEVRMKGTSTLDPATMSTKMKDESLSGKIQTEENQQDTNFDETVNPPELNFLISTEEQTSGSAKPETFQDENKMWAEKAHLDSVFQERGETVETTEKEINKKLQTNPEEEDGLFLNNAGLVLLHPFFESLFGHFDLLVNGQFKDSESQTIAVHLLHYLATKEELGAEHQLIMEKYLCGWELNQPIEREILLPQKMKNECETLLAAAISHWKTLGNTSPDGLREGFLQREGKLLQNEFQDRLIVEKRSFDILLSYLPWGYGIIKLPWLNMPLYVEWQ